MISLGIWTGALVAIYGWVRTAGQFFAVAAIVAIVLGGSQALSRSLYSLMIPKGKEAEYFGLYEISDKGTSWLGPLVFALALQFTRSYRVAILIGRAAVIDLWLPLCQPDRKGVQGSQRSTRGLSTSGRCTHNNGFSHGTSRTWRPSASPANRGGIHMFKKLTLVAMMLLIAGAAMAQAPVPVTADAAILDQGTTAVGAPGNPICDRNGPSFRVATRAGAAQ
jgi:MFS family permease